VLQHGGKVRDDKNQGAHNKTQEYDVLRHCRAVFVLAQLIEELQKLHDTPLPILFSTSVSDGYVKSSPAAALLISFLASCRTRRIVNYPCAIFPSQYTNYLPSGTRFGDLLKSLPGAKNHLPER
jgi:hypothetical protein